MEYAKISIIFIYKQIVNLSISFNINPCNRLFSIITLENKLFRKMLDIFRNKYKISNS